MSRTAGGGQAQPPHRQGDEPRRGVAGDDARRGCASKGVILRGGGLDESPHVYRRLPDVLAAQQDTIEVLHTLRPLIVVMAGADEWIRTRTRFHWVPRSSARFRRVQFHEVPPGSVPRGSVPLPRFDKRRHMLLLSKRKRSTSGRRSNELASRIPRFARAQDAGARAATRVGGVGAAWADVGQGGAGASGLAVSGPAQAREAGLDSRKDGVPRKTIDAPSTTS